MRAWVTGATGQLGYDIVRELKAQEQVAFGTSRNAVDIIDTRAVVGMVRSIRPDVVFHCAAYTAVDDAESHPQVCTAINVQGTENIAKACCRRVSRRLCEHRLCI